MDLLEFKEIQIYEDPFRRTFYVLRGHKRLNNFLTKWFRKKNSYIFFLFDIKRYPKLHSIWPMLKKRNPVYAYRTQFTASCFIYIYIAVAIEHDNEESKSQQTKMKLSTA